MMGPDFEPIDAPRVVLVATDFSAPGDKAVAHAAWIAKSSGARLYVLHVVQPTAGVEWGDTSGLAVSAYFEQEREAREEKLLKTVLAVERDGIEAKPVLAVGSPAVLIAEEADRVEADLVVMGTRGHGAVRRLITGSVAHAVAAKTTRPLLLIH